MHAMCTIVARNLSTIERCMNYYSQERTWDYASIGGRYSNLIPVSKKCKTYYAGIGWPDIPHGQFPYPDRMEPNPALQYTNIARMRNIVHDEVVRMAHGGGLDIFLPYTMIICHEDDWFEWLDIDEMGEGQLANLHEVLQQPNKQSWFVAIVDYHY